MPEGGTLTISSRAISSGSPVQPATVTVEIKDTGEGMTAEQQKRAFSSLLNSTKRGGTGLGLAIVHRIVEAHHGNLTVRSQPAKGTKILIELPQYSEPT
jgi:signal transduction histidine kinase